MKVLKYSFILILSLIFLVSGVSKVLSPQTFMDNLKQYNMFPQWMMNLAVIFLPWLEILCGFFLLFPALRRPSCILIIGMNILFIMVLSIALLKGVRASCGCFGTLSEEISFQAVVRDLAFLFMALFIYLS